MSGGTELTEAERRFVSGAVRRRRLFGVLSGVGIAAAAILMGLTVWRYRIDPDFPLGAHVALVILVLLNARQNLRQYRYAGVLQKLSDRSTP